LRDYTEEEKQALKGHLAQQISREIREMNNNDRLIQCPSCDRDISKFAEVCPHCGHPKPNATVVQNLTWNELNIGQKTSRVGCYTFLVLFCCMFVVMVFKCTISPDEVSENRTKTLSPTMQRINIYREFVGMEKVDKPPAGVTEDQFEAIHRLDAARQGMNPDNFFH